jgi:hypothetical protein
VDPRITVEKKTRKAHMSKKNSDDTACVEHGIWTALPAAPPATTSLDFATVSATGNSAIIAAGKMTFHMVGCAGDPDVPGPGLAVGNGMASQIGQPGSGVAVAPSFFYHLGDIVYTESGSTMTTDLWQTQFFQQYAAYTLPIFAIAGNHDGNGGSKPDETEIYYFDLNFQGASGTGSSDKASGTGRAPAIQPYTYWRLDTPYAYILGLYTNVANAGMLDDPKPYTDPTQGPQYQWLVSQLTYCKTQNAGSAPKAVLLALHYPPYSGAVNFTQRGDPTMGPSPGAANAQPIGMLLEQAYAASGQIPDAVFSAHAHLYQRLTVTRTDAQGNRRQTPYLIAGAGGHTSVEILAEQCSGSGNGTIPALPFDIFANGNIPQGLSAPATAAVELVAYADGTNTDAQPYGFLRVTVTPTTLVGEYFTTLCDKKGNGNGQLTLSDSFTLDLTTHLLT